LSETSKPQRVAIAGATGYIGGRLIPQLLNSGYSVRCLARSPGKLLSREWAKDPRVEIVRADLADAESLASNLVGCQAVFYLVHSMTSAGAGYPEQDNRLASVFAGASRKAGVERIIYLGGLGETGAGLSEHLSSRRQVEEALASTGVPVTVLRAAMIIGSGSASFEILRYLVERLPIMITPKWVSTPCQPIGVRNVIGYLVGTLSQPEMAGRVFDIGGPDVLCYRDIMRVMAEEMGLPRRWILPVPVLSPRLSSYWIHLITPLSHNFCELCNRVRLTCTGTLHTCLGQEDATDLRAVLRAGASDADLIEAIRGGIDAKPKGHDFEIARARPAVARHMSTTGG